nr:adenylate isopentenyltransferase 3, chloroplastic-like [Tanacetum cinerariifolium]
MKMTMMGCQQAQPSLLQMPTGGMDYSVLRKPPQKDKVVVVMGATGTGKSRLSIDLATRYRAEIINSDKIQVYEGLDIVTNKMTYEECEGVPHHLLGIVDPEADFTAQNFVSMASLTMKSIVGRGKLPIIAGGSNSFIEALIDDQNYEFRSRYDVCFLWVDVAMPLLHRFVSDRVDRMVSAAISQTKINTCKLACRQLEKIRRLQNVKEWDIHRLDATPVFRKQGQEANELWAESVAGPSSKIVYDFLNNFGNSRSFVGAGDNSRRGNKRAAATMTMVAAAL